MSSKRLLSLLLVVVLIASLLPCNVAFAEESQTTVITVEDSSAVPGKTVAVNITIKNNPGILAMTLKLTYDETIATLVSVENGEAMSDMSFAPPVGDALKSGCQLSWDAETVDPDSVRDGVIATLTFRIAEDAEFNQAMTVGITSVGSIIDDEINPIVAEMVAGTLKVEYIPGDVNCDGMVSSTDTAYLRRYIAGGYGIAIYEPAGDVNADGLLTAVDVAYIRRYIAGGYGIVLKPAQQCTHGTLQATEAKAATCTAEGNIAYWACTECGKYFGDAEAKSEIAYTETKLALADHSVEKVEKIDPTCTATGTEEHWKCTVCGALFADAEAKTEITDTTISATGHTLSKAAGVEPTYTEPGVAEHWKCTVCGTLFADENGETRIDLNDTVIAPKKSYQIVYDLYDDNSTYLETVGVENPNQAYYDPETGLVLADLQAEGYTFMGWYDDNGARVREITAGTTGLVGLAAKWKPKEYTLTKRDLVNDTESITFTPESSFELETPVWRHLTFSHWEDTSEKLESYTDATGTARLKLNQGTIGNIEVVAKWKNPINQVVNNNSDNNLIGCQYEEDAQMYWFVYEIGKIEKVILGNKEDYAAQYHSGGNHELTHTKQVSITEETGTSLAELSASTVSKSTEWGTVREDVLTVSENIGMSVKTGIEAEEGVEGVAKVKESIELETSIDFGIEASTGIQESKSTGEEITKESSQEVCNTFVYAKTIDYSETTATQMTPEDPVGYYRNVNAATLKVYAVVIYDPATMTCYLETYSVISDTYLYPLYEREGYVDYANDSISYKVDVAQIEGYIKSAYYIQYDAYDGDEKMPITVAAKGAEIAVRTDFTRTGYTLTGWKYLDENGAEQQIILAQGQNNTVKNLTEVGKTVTLKAIWTKNAYTIQYSANKPSGASNFVQNMPSDQACFYDTEVTLASAPTLTGWTFDGWYHNGEQLGAGTVTKNLTTEFDGTVTLTGNWTANDYTITYHKNDGSGTTTSATYKFDSTTSTLAANPYSWSNYEFKGWSTDANAITPDYDNEAAVGALAYSSDAISGNINLYAVWVKTTAYVDFTAGNGTRDKTLGEGDSYTETVSTGMSKEALTANGYTKIQINVKFDAKRSDLIMFNNAVLKLIANGKVLGDRTWDIGDHFNKDSWTYDVQKTFEINVSDLNADGSFSLKWSNEDDGTWSTSEKWYLGETNITVTAS